MSETQFCRDNFTHVLTWGTWVYNWECRSVDFQLAAGLCVSTFTGIITYIQRDILLLPFEFVWGFDGEAHMLMWIAASGSREGIIIVDEEPVEVVYYPVEPVVGLAAAQLAGCCVLGEPTCRQVVGFG